MFIVYSAVSPPPDRAVLGLCLFRLPLPPALIDVFFTSVKHEVVRSVGLFVSHLSDDSRSEDIGYELGKRVCLNIGNNR